MSPTFKKSIWLLTALFAILLVALAFILNRVAPGPADQEILGVTIGHWEFDDDRAYLSGKRLFCQETTGSADPYDAVCAIDIQGETLTIWATRNDPSSNMMLGGECTATYGGETLRCDLGSRHVHVHWFAFVEKPEALGAADLAQLRQQFWLENRPDSFFIGLIWLISGVTAALAVANLFALLWERSRSRMVLSILGGIPVALVFFYIGVFGALWLTGPFFD